MKLSTGLTLEHKMWEVCLRVRHPIVAINEDLLIFINSRSRPKAVIFASSFAFSLSSLVLYNFETALTIMDWKHIF